ncbi:slit homolog 2 protein-like [Pleurodeles waltl]|uniref:slit homolog 2 protein-like n=1 Tax=Pleurodeles waltl TaxID=8319 RepID=UPI00370986C6
MEPPSGGPCFLLLLLLASPSTFLLDFAYGSNLEFVQRPATMAAAQGPKHSSPSRNDSRARYVIPCGKQCRCLRHVLSCAGGEGSDRLTQIPTIVGYNDTFFYLDFSANSISTFHKRSWLTYSWAEILILKQNNVRKLHKDSFEGLLLLQHLDLSSNKIHTIARHVFEPVPFLQSLNLADNKLTKFTNGTFEAWHGMQFLASFYDDDIIVDERPTVDESSVDDVIVNKDLHFFIIDDGNNGVCFTIVDGLVDSRLLGKAVDDQDLHVFVVDDSSNDKDYIHA